MACSEELQAVLERLRRRPLHPGALGDVVLCGTGFFGAARTAVRELAELAGCLYCGDLTRGSTTHLVLAPAGAAATATASGGSTKQQKAADWGIPCVPLSWLLDSIAARQAQPLRPTAGVGNTPLGHEQLEEGMPLAAPAPSPAAPTCQLPLRHRPSSIASNAPGAVSGAAPHRRQQQPGHPSPVPHSQHLEQPSRQPLGSVANVLADQLRRMSISPELPPQLGSPVAAAGSCREHQVLLHPADSPPLQRSPSHSLPGSPQRSLSLQGLVADCSDRGTPAEATSRGPAEAASAGSWQPWAGHSAQRAVPHQHATSPAAGSPMHESPAGALLSKHEQQQQSQQQQQQQHASAWVSPELAAAPLPFRLSLGRSTTEDLPAGSPMAESPAMPTAAAAAAAADAGNSSGYGASVQRPRSRLACTPAREGSEQPMCTLPTPACIRNWSDDDSLGPSPAGTRTGGEGEGVTQTPPAVRQALAAANEPTQQPFWGEQRQQQQQLELDEAAPFHSMHSSGQPAAPAVRDWSDDETVASEPPAAGELVIPDSQSEEDCPEPHAQQQQQQTSQLPLPEHEQQQQQLQAVAQPPRTSSAQTSPTPLPPARPQQQAHQLPLQQQPGSQAQQPPRKRGLLLVSRTSVPGQKQPPQTTARAPAMSAAGQRAPEVAATSPASPPAAGLAAAGDVSCGGGQDEPMPSPSGGDCEPPQPMSGSGRTSPSSGRPFAQRPAAGQGDQAQQQQQQQQQQQRPMSSSSAGPEVDEHFVTARRPGGGTAAGASRQQRTVRDWSEDESSSGDEFPTPKGPLNRADGLTGLSQLDPSSLIIARPKPFESTATWRSGGTSSAVHGIKFLQRPPRGNCVRAHHPTLANLKSVHFAEQVQVATAGGLMLSTKDKKTAVRLQAGGLTEAEAEDDEFQAASASSRRASSSSTVSGASRSATPEAQQREHGQGQGQGQGLRGAQQNVQQQQQQLQQEPVLAEPATFYQLPDGTWWLEHYLLYTAAQAEAAAAAAGQALTLPAGYDRGCELLRAVARGHAPMADIAGGVQVRRLKQGSSMLRLKGGVGGGARSYFWRLNIDTATWRLVTDRPAADYVAVE